MAAPTTLDQIVTEYAKDIADLTGDTPATEITEFIAQVHAAADLLATSPFLEDAAGELSAAASYLEDARSGGDDRAALIKRAHERLWGGIELAA